MILAKHECHVVNLDASPRAEVVVTAHYHEHGETKKIVFNASEFHAPRINDRLKFTVATVADEAE